MVVRGVIRDLERAVGISQLKIVNGNARNFADNLVNFGVDVLHACGHHNRAVVRLRNAGVRRSGFGVLFIVENKAKGARSVGIIRAGSLLNTAVIGENPCCKSEARG